MALFGTQLVVTRVVAPSSKSVGQPPTSSKTGTGDVDLKNILTMVPSEAVAPFLSAKVAVPPTLSPYVWVWICFAVCLLICLALRIKASQPNDARGLQQVNWPLVLASAVAFFIWAQATTDESLMIPVFHGSFAGLAAMAYGIIVPRFVPATATGA